MLASPPRSCGPEKPCSSKLSGVLHILLITWIYRIWGCQRQENTQSMPSTLARSTTSLLPFLPLHTLHPLQLCTGDTLLAPVPRV